MDTAEVAAPVSVGSVEDGGGANSDISEAADTTVEAQQSLGPCACTGEAGTERRAKPGRTLGEVAAQFALLRDHPVVGPLVRERRRELERRALWCRLWLNQCVCVKITSTPR